MRRVIIASFPAWAILAVALFILTTPALACETVRASWYGPGFHGRATASGERFNSNAFTAAHRTLPFGAKLRVTYRGKSVVVRITDRGPYIHGRSLDLSKAAAQKIGLIPAGVGNVCIERGTLYFTNPLTNR